METLETTNEDSFAEDFNAENKEKMEAENMYDDFYLNEIENFFREDFENDIIEDETIF